MHVVSEDRHLVRAPDRRRPIMLLGAMPYVSVEPDEGAERAVVEVVGLGEAEDS